MRLARNHRLDVRRRARHHIRLAEIAVVGQHQHGLEHQADACAQPLSAFDSRFDRGLVPGNLSPAVIHNRGDDSQQT